MPGFGLDTKPLDEKLQEIINLLSTLVQLSIEEREKRIESSKHLENYMRGLDDMFSRLNGFKEGDR